LSGLLFQSLGLAFLTLAGCGGNPKPQIGPIQFTTASGASVPSVTSLAVNGQAYVVATVTNDDQLLGVSWTVTCGSAAPPGGTTIDSSCGTFDPSQTLSGPVPLYPSSGIVAAYNAPSDIPVGGTVTIIAHVTALPSVTSGVTVTIVAAQTSKVEPASTPGKKSSQAYVASVATASRAIGARGAVPRQGL
jgi:hypothetical protein